MKRFIPLSRNKGMLKISGEQWFMISAMIVNAGNYLYNLVIGRMLGPEKFAEASLLVTLLLILSFLAMTFQLTAAKFTAESDLTIAERTIQVLQKYGLRLGLLLSFLLIVFAFKFSSFFNSDSSLTFIVFALSIPAYILMSIGRGQIQGERSFYRLASSYQLEMLIRLFLTVALLFILNIDTSIIISIGIVVSVILGYLPVRLKPQKKQFNKQLLPKAVLVFALYTSVYELSQVLINNTDILLVKHYFPSDQAGLYAALAMIGRVVFFVAWMFAMVLLPNVIAAEKAGQDSRPLLWKYIMYTTVLGVLISGFSFLFPEFIINMLFGSLYISIAPLLWLYALATSLFAISNIFAYYFLSKSVYTPVYLTLGFGIVQVLSVICFHDTLEQVVLVQLILMTVLLLMQALHYIWFGWRLASNKLPPITYTIDRNFPTT